MKRVLFPIILVLLLSSTVCFAADRELRFSPSYLIPGDDDTWDSAVGIDIQYLVWNTPTFGVALSGGIGLWQTNEDIYYEDGFGSELEGDAMTFPFGASVLYKPVVNDSSEITFEAGVRYVIVESNADITVTDGYYIYKDEVDIDNGLVGLVGVDLAFPISQTTKFSFGAGYQFDISKGDGTWLGAELGDNEMKGLFLRLGFNLKM